MVTYIFKYLIFIDDRPGAYLDLLLGAGRCETYVFDLPNNAIFSVDDVLHSLSSFKNVWP
jgi:hypothetical protein